MKPIEGIWSDAELARSSAKKPKKLSNYCVLYRFVSLVQWGEIIQSKTGTNWREVRARTSEKLGLGKWVNLFQEGNLTATKAKVKAILPNNALRLLLSRS
jgi:N6-adenosine-specific RNA methylase IME4